MDDYRNTKYCPILENVEQKKKKLLENIRKNHTTENICSVIRKNDGEYKRPFMKIYNDKCAYCGNSIVNLKISEFEIDHIKNKASSQDNSIENLVISCCCCNRNKNDIVITDEYMHVLNTENGEIAKVFYRDSLYNIHITNEYISDVFIKKFYQKIQFYKQTRRIDYLLLEMSGIIKTLDKKDKVLSAQLSRLFIKLKEKRNLFPN